MALDLLSANPTKYSNALKQFVGLIPRGLMSFVEVTKERFIKPFSFDEKVDLSVINLWRKL